MNQTPLVSVIIPVLNAANVLPACLDAIYSQKYSKIEVILADGGSTDHTLQLAAKYSCQVVSNRLQTSESGKVAGLSQAKGKYIALIDSDNILPDPYWLSQMIAPLENDSSLVGSEPWEFTYRPSGGFIERYSALLGVNDPYAYVLGIYDRKNAITNKWSAISLPQENHSGYLKIKLIPQHPIPTIGANGTIFRHDFLKNYLKGDYLFDIDLLTSALNSLNKPLYFAKIKNGIIHTYCESSISKFYRKQSRRLRDYFSYRQLRTFNYQNKLNQNPFHDLLVLVRNNFKFTFYTILIVPMLITTIKGYLRRPDNAWFFHPFACLITLYLYVSISLASLLGLHLTQSRQQWQQ